MEYVWIIGGVVVIGGLIAAMAAGSQVASVQKSFASLGDMTGKSKAEIVAAVGAPTSVSAIPEGSLLQWQIINQSGAYHIAIAFDQDDQFLGVTHEHAS